MWLFALFSCGPLFVSMAAWLYLVRTRRWPRPVTIAALSVLTLNALVAVRSFVVLSLRSSAKAPPPWQDVAVLTTALLFFLAPVGMILGLVAAGRRESPAWMIVLIEVASLPLMALGVLATMAV